ncbi:MAG: acyl-CoA dehydrogenase family protein [Acidobacteriota bacterium]
MWKKAAELGFIGIHFPEKYSGQGLGVLENILVAEEFCSRDSTIGSALILAGFGSECILRFGNDELKEKFLPPVAEGEMLSAGAFTEADHGSDITFMSTLAESDGEEWVINGSKIFITNGELASFFCVLCQTDPECKPTHRGMSLFLVEADRKGVSATDVGDKMGVRMMSTAEITFKNVRIPASNLIGKQGKGFYHVLEFFDESRILVAAQALGTAQGAGCSLAAVRNGRSVDTTMGFTPLEGLMMGSRCGTIDPGILIHLLREEGYSADRLEDLLNRESGLLGISGLSDDMRQILSAIENGNSRARLAFETFIHRLRHHIGAMIASLGGLDALAFTAGIGENSPQVRADACAGFEFLSLKLDQQKNAQSPVDCDIAEPDSAVRVAVVAAREDWAIAQECWKLARSGQAPGL